MMIRTMIIDDSDVSRRSLSEALESSNLVEVVCKLGDEKGVPEMISWISPDVVFVSAAMCTKKGFSFFDSLMKKNMPMIVTGNGKEEMCDELMELLERGAVDFLVIPSEIEEAILKVKNAAKARPIDIKDRLSAIKVKFPTVKGLGKGVVIASSTGGPQALKQIIPKLPSNFPGVIIIIQHIGKGFTSSLAKSLDGISLLRVKEAEDQEPLMRSVVYVAPYGHHLHVENNRFILKEGVPLNGVIPSADIAMKSVSECFGSESIGVILTGMGRDGTAGIVEIKKKKGRIIVQDRSTSVVFGMPEAALKTGVVDKVVEIEGLAEVLAKEATR